MHHKIEAPYWAFPSPGDEHFDWDKMKKHYERKGDYRTSRRVELKIMVMDNPDIFTPTWRE